MMSAMDFHHTLTSDSHPHSVPDYEPPTFEVITLDCEITSYAPDGDQPLF